MQTVVTERGQISIPSELRRKFKLLPGTGVEWLETPEGIYLLPVPEDPVAGFRGRSRGLAKTLATLRREERRRDP